jgi:hypothetical protein
MIMCYGKQVYDIELVEDKWGNVRAIVQYGKNGKQHNVSCESISWVSPDWFDKD